MVKRVKVQPRQHTILFNDEELGIILDAIQFFSAQHPKTCDLEYRERVMKGSNPIYDKLYDIVDTLSFTGDKRPTRFVAWEDE